MKAKAWLAEAIRERAPTCFLCRWIRDSMAEDGTLRDAQAMHDGKFLQPVEAQVAHLKLEFGSGDGA